MIKSGYITPTFLPPIEDQSETKSEYAALTFPHQHNNGQEHVAALIHPAPHSIVQTPQFTGVPPHQRIIKHSPHTMYQPAYGTPYDVGYGHSQTTNELAKYLARSQLVTSGLTS